MLIICEKKLNIDIKLSLVCLKNWIGLFISFVFKLSVVFILIKNFILDGNNDIYINKINNRLKVR